MTNMAEIRITVVEDAPNLARASDAYRTSLVPFPIIDRSIQALTLPS